MGVVTPLLAKRATRVRRKQAGNHRQQGIAERFDRTLYERLFGAQYAKELLLAAQGSSEQSVDWDKQLPNLKVVAVINDEQTEAIMAFVISSGSSCCWPG